MACFLQPRVQKPGRRGRQSDRRGTQGQPVDHQHQVSPHTPCLYLIMGGHMMRSVLRRVIMGSLFAVSSTTSWALRAARHSPRHSRSTRLSPTSSKPAYAWSHYGGCMDLFLELITIMGTSSFLLQPRSQRPGPARQRRDQVRLGRPRRQPPALKSWPPPRILYFAPRPIKFPSQITVHRSICRFIGVWQQESQSQRPQRDSNTGQSPQLCPGFSRRRLAPPDHPTPGAPAPVVAASQYSL